MFELIPGLGGGGLAQVKGMDMSFFIMLGGMILIFYFMLIRPQKQQQKKHDDMIKSLQKGDKILTRGGVYGTIEKVTEHSLRVKVAENVVLRMTKSAVASKTSVDEAE